MFFSLPPSAAHTKSTFRRQVSLIQPSDVIITNIRNNAQGVLEFEMYIQVAGGARVLGVEVLESAVQVSTVLFCPYCKGCIEILLVKYSTGNCVFVLCLVLR